MSCKQEWGIYSIFRRLPDNLEELPHVNDEAFHIYLLSYLIPYSHQGLNTFKSCLVEHSFFVSFIKAAFGFLSTTDLA